MPKGGKIRFANSRLSPARELARIKAALSHVPRILTWDKSTEEAVWHLEVAKAARMREVVPQRVRRSYAPRSSLGENFGAVCTMLNEIKDIKGDISVDSARRLLEASRLVRRQLVVAENRHKNKGRMEMYRRGMTNVLSVRACSDDYKGPADVTRFIAR